MHHLIVIIFDHPKEAGKVLDVIDQAETQHQIRLNDSAIVIKDEKGQVHVQSELRKGLRDGAMRGGLAGLVVGLLFGGPIGAAAIGGAGGAVIGSLKDTGLQREFVDSIAASLKPNSSALFLAVKKVENPGAVIEALKPYKGEIYHTTLPPVARERLQQVLNKRLES